MNSYNYFDSENLSKDQIPSMSKGFSSISKPKGKGTVFSELIEKVAQVDPEMRIRYTSPHPKDFPDDVTFSF